MLNRADANQIRQLRTSLRQFGAQAKNYVSLVTWLLHTFFKGRVRRLILAFGMNFASLGTQGIGIGVIYWYARQMQSGRAAELPLLETHANLSSETLLWLVVLVASSAFLASALFMFLSRMMIWRVAEEHLAESLEALIRLTARLPDPRARVASRIFADHGLSPLVGGCTHGALTTVVFSNAIAGAFGGVAAAGVLFWIDATLTAIIVLSVGLGTLFLYPLALRAAALLKLNVQARYSFRQEAVKLQQSGISSGVLRTPTQLARTQIARRKVTTQFRLRTEIMVAVMLGAVVFYLANQAFSGRSDWALFIAYVGALRIVLSASTHLIRAFANLSRYYPSVIRYYVVLKELGKIDQRPFGAVLHPGDTLRLGVLRTGEEIFARTGDRFAVVAARNPKADLTLALLSARPVGSDLPLRIEFITPNVTPSHGAHVAIFDTSKFPARLDLSGLDDALKNKVTLIVRDDPNEFGTEEQLLTVLDGEFQSLTTFGTGECEAALKEFRRRSAKATQKRRFLEDEDEDEQ
jgi:hypothetical protein